MYLSGMVSATCSKRSSLFKNNVNVIEKKTATQQNEIMKHVLTQLFLRTD